MTISFTQQMFQIFIEMKVYYNSVILQVVTTKDTNKGTHILVFVLKCKSNAFFLRIDFHSEIRKFPCILSVFSQYIYV